MTQVEAEKALAAVDLKATVEERADDTVEVGRVDHVGPRRQHRGRHRVHGEARRVDRPGADRRPAGHQPSAGRGGEGPHRRRPGPRVDDRRERRRRPGHGRGPEPGARCPGHQGLAGRSRRCEGRRARSWCPTCPARRWRRRRPRCRTRASGSSTEGTAQQHGRARAASSAPIPPAGTSLKKNAVVTIIVSSGKEQVKVPSVTGQTEAEATETLRGSGFEVEVATQDLPANDSQRTVGCWPRTRGPTARWTTVRPCASPSARPRGHDDVDDQHDHIGSVTRGQRD